MSEISPNLLDRADAVEVRGARPSKRTQLREDEPHPMGLIASGSELSKDRLEDEVLCCNEARKLERIVIYSALDRPYDDDVRSVRPPARTATGPLLLTR
jgi:hypothetical protein